MSNCPLVRSPVPGPVITSGRRRRCPGRYRPVMTLSVSVAGATGWTGRPVAEAVLAADDLDLCSAVSRSAAGDDLGRAWGGEAIGVPVFARAADALDGAQVLVDFTAHDAVLGHTLAAIERGGAVVIGTSGLGADDFAEIDAAARRHGVGVVA